MSNKPIKKGDSNKAWNRKKTTFRPYLIEKRSKKKTFLIVCEGENTEPEYLKSIPAPNADIVFGGGGFQKTSLVREALRLSKLEKNKGREVWCVYDMDYNGNINLQKQDFNESIVLARRSNMKVAYSNDSFELWFVLHYKFIASALTRREYYEFLEEI
jgi:hypothetical protein